MRTTIYSSVPHKLLTALLIISMVLVALPVTAAYADSTITVTTTSDEFDGSGPTPCSLREAIALANNPDPNVLSLNDCTRAFSADPNDTIVLQSGFTYTLTLPGAGGTSVGDLDIGDSSGLSGNLTIEASGSTPAIIDASGLALGGIPDRVLDVDAPGDPSLTLINIIVTNGDTTGQATTAGGGISFDGLGTLTLINSTVSDNVSASDAGCGGGIFNNSAATVVITDSTISGNSCPTLGSDGGGIFKSNGGSLTITDSTIANNTTAENGGGMHIGASGATTVAITNSTFAGNTAGNRGGGLQVGGTLAVVTVDFSTFSDNVANEVSMTTPGLDGGGALQVSLGSVTVTRSILANSIVTNGVPGTAKDCHKAGMGSPIASVTDSILENNSVSINNACTGSFTSGDPALGALASNGGPTQTMAIPLTSLAFNTADSCGSVTTDQRGLTRPMVGACDLGAYEVQDANLPTVSSVIRANPDPTNDPSVNYTVTFSESVTGVDAGDFSPTMGGSVTGATVGVVTGSGTTWTVPINTGMGDGTIRLDVIDNNTIQDVDLNFLDGGFTAGEVYTVDKTVPTISAITRADNEIMGTATVDFGVAFSESVTGVTTGDFSPPIMGGAVSGASVSGVSGLGSTYTVTVNTGSGDGTLGINLDASGTGIVDAAGNAISNGGFTGDVYTILKSASLVDVNIAGSIPSGGNDINIPLHTGQRHGFPVDNGPAQVVSANGLDIVTALRVIWQEPGERTSYSEMMGLPVEQLSSEYWFPWYNNLDKAAMDQGFRIANVDVADTTIKVMLGGPSGTQLDSFTLAAGASVRKNYQVNNGPIQIYSVEGTNILAALRVIWQEPAAGRYSYSEMMGLPKEQLSDEYWFPWYNNLDKAAMDQGFRIASVNATSSNTVQVWIGNSVTPVATINLGIGASVRVNYDANTGPVRIVCTTCSGNEKIVTTLRVIWQEPGFRSSYSEMMGMPLEQLSTEYWFPWYNNLDKAAMDQGFRIANVNATGPNTIQVWVGNTMQDSFSLAVGASVRVGYEVNTGPIRIVCTTCAGSEKIVTTLRVIWQEPEPNLRTSYSEMMGLPVEALSTEYWFPWYNNAVPASMDQGFRIAVP
ncbi:MAG: CSLREA domain-containing protein [Anaerolineae bacterium]|nr:CSLREA domain-containing protein [Anaerolineae bacterium]